MLTAFSRVGNKEEECLSFTSKISVLEGHLRDMEEHVNGTSGAEERDRGGWLSDSAGS